jgi:DnaJ-class molecular chaperone
MNLYNLLSVNQKATEKEIRHAYILRAKDLHPDRNPDDKEAEDLFKKINQAYSILSDKYKRKQYSFSMFCFAKDFFHDSFATRSTISQQ